jgi:3-oxoacyl-[acyl-carrier protein] reductase
MASPLAPTPLTGRVALVVGGSGGIGRATAQLLAEAGARCVITTRPSGRTAGEAQSLVAALPGEGHLALEVDVADTASILRLRDAVEARCGRLDILVNTAGFTQPVPHADLDGLSDELIDRMFQVNWRGVFATVRAFAPLLKASGDGLVVSVSSIAGSTGVGSSIAYCAVKAATDVMTKSLARVLAPAVRVLAVSPGVVDTEFVGGRGPEANAKLAASIPLKRIATAQDVAAAILACATHLVYATGSIIEVDGGRRLG